MRRVHLAELRDSWTAWLGVAIVFVAVNVALVLPTVVMYGGFQALASGQLDFVASSLYTIMQALAVVMIAFVAVPVIGSATGLVVDSRRGSLARLGLAGATPAQVRRTLVSQLVAVSLACAVLGDLIGVTLVGPYLELQEYNTEVVPFRAPVSIVGILAANAVCVLIALLGGARQARVASEIPPVEALRTARTGIPRRRLGASGWVKVVLLGLAIVACFVSVPVQVEHRYKETVSNLIIMTILQIFLCGAFVAALGPVLMAPLTRAWTRLVPSANPAWVLARTTAGARADRLYKSVTPVMFTVGISAGFVGLGLSMVATFVASGQEIRMGVSTFTDFVAIFGLPLLVAFAGSVGTLLMMSKQRDGELALAGIAGAAPPQRVALPLLEASIITGTAVLLALVEVVGMYAFMAYAMTSAGLTYVPVVPVPTLALAIGICWLITVLATVLPTLPALRLPEPRVIARLVAE